MATKQALYDHLQRLTEENRLLRCENESFRSVLLSIYVSTRGVLGIEAAAQAREDARQAALQDAASSQTGSSHSIGNTKTLERIDIPD